MLFVVFRVGADRYALDVRCIAEVLPLLTVRPVPGAPAGVAGVFLFRGTPVPVVDLQQALVGSAAARRASTRLVVVNLADERGIVRQLGLIAGSATATVRINASDFSPPVVSSESHPALGQVAVDSSGMIQQLNPESLLPPEARRRLYQEIAG